MSTLGTDPTDPAPGGGSPRSTSAVEPGGAVAAATRRGLEVDLPPWRDRLGAVLLSLCALGALAAAVTATTTVSDADTTTRAVETWRLVGYAYFAGIFVLLALAPRQLRGLWELTIAAKLALPLAGATFLRGSTDAGTFVVVDGIVTLVLIGAYVSMAGWTAPLRIGGRKRSRRG